jgi:hypothetical protein
VKRGRRGGGGPAITFPVAGSWTAFSGVRGEADGSARVSLPSTWVSDGGALYLSARGSDFRLPRAV